jgi:hypothetical protein
MKFLLLNTLFLFCSLILLSQNSETVVNNIFADLLINDNHSGKVKIYQDERIETLVNKHIIINQKQNGFMGYRIQVFFGSGSDAKKKAQEIKTDISAKFPEVESHLIYDTPNFKLRLGDFRTKNDAFRFKMKLADEYPSAFIVEDIIDFPKLN